jgi:hypothetical protein
VRLISSGLRWRSCPAGSRTDELGAAAGSAESSQGRTKSPATDPLLTEARRAVAATL